MKRYEHMRPNYEALTYEYRLEDHTERYELESWEEAVDRFHKIRLAHPHSHVTMAYHEAPYLEESIISEPPVSISKPRVMEQGGEVDSPNEVKKTLVYKLMMQCMGDIEGVVIDKGDSHYLIKLNPSISNAESLELIDCIQEDERMTLFNVYSFANDRFIEVIVATDPEMNELVETYYQMLLKGRDLFLARQAKNLGAWTIVLTQTGGVFHADMTLIEEDEQGNPVAAAKNLLVFTDEAIVKKFLRDNYGYVLEVMAQGGVVTKIDRIKDIPATFQLVNNRPSVYAVLDRLAPEMEEWKKQVGGLYVSYTKKGHPKRILVYEGEEPTPDKPVWEVYPKTQYMRRGGNVDGFRYARGGETNRYFVRYSSDSNEYDEYFGFGSNPPEIFNASSIEEARRLAEQDAPPNARVSQVALASEFADGGEIDKLIYDIDELARGGEIESLIDEIDKLERGGAIDEATDDSLDDLESRIETLE